MIPVLKLENYDDSIGYLGLAYKGTSDTPRLAWFAVNDEFVRKAGSGCLDIEVWTVSMFTLIYWEAVIVQWLKDGQNDVLRARGDIRWRVASRAHLNIKAEMEDRQ